jgi:hypothetical protein
VRLNVTAQGIPATPVDELAELWRSLPPIGEWVDDAACGSLVDAVVWTADVPDPDELAVAERVCRRCPVREECHAYAAQAPVWGLWGGIWNGTPRRQQPAA